MAARQQVDLNTLLAQLQVIRDQIAKLQARIAELTALKDNVARARDSLKVIKENGGSVVMMPLDSQMNAIIKVAPVDTSKVLVHLGLDVYARLSIDEAIRILDEKESNILKTIGVLNKQLRDLVRLHEQYQAIISQAVARARAEAEAKK